MTAAQYERLPLRKRIRAIGAGEIPNELYPPGWLERAEALESGEAVAGDWSRLAPRFYRLEVVA